MDEIEVTIGTTGEPIQHKLAKLVLGTVAGFLASEGVKKVYTAVLEKRNENTTTDSE